MENIYIYHHLGLGDHIILNGFVRHFAEQYKKIYLFSKHINAKNVDYMYRDLGEKIQILGFDDNGVKNYMKMFPNNYLVVGHTPDFFRRIDDPTNGKYFDQLFFEDHNINFEDKWNKFHYERNIKKEKEVFYDIYGLKDDSEFIFIHESRERPITRDIPENIQVIRPDKMEVRIFDFLFLMEKAKQIHVMNSSFMNLIDCIQLRQDNLFYHEYARPGINTVLKLPWKVLK